jgi:hypothetical protein
LLYNAILVIISTILWREILINNFKIKQEKQSQPI